jgi:hypothetical protein
MSALVGVVFELFLAAVDIVLTEKGNSLFVRVARWFVGLGVLAILLVVLLYLWNRSGADGA